MCSSTAHFVIPPDHWARDCITMIYQSKTSEDFGDAFDDFIAKDAEIIVDGVKVTRDEYKQKLQGQCVPESIATVKFAGVVRANTLENAVATGTGALALIFIVTFSAKITTRTIVSSVNIAVEIDKTVVPTEAEDFDDRRAVLLNQVFTDATVTNENSGA